MTTDNVDRPDRDDAENRAPEDETSTGIEGSIAEAVSHVAQRAARTDRNGWVDVVTAIVVTAFAACVAFGIIKLFQSL